MKPESKESPVTIGAEVESIYPGAWPNDTIRNICWGIKGYPFSGLSPSIALDYRDGQETDPTEMLCGQKRIWQIHKWEAGIPEEYRSPGGWERGWEAQHEFRFRGPAPTYAEAHKRFDNLGAYFKAWGHRPSNYQYGTHIHLGVKEWLDRRFPAQVRQDWFNSEVARLLYAAIMFRNPAIWSLIPLERRTHNSGGTFTLPAYSNTTPLYQIHQFVNQRGCPRYSALIAGRKFIPTFEMRTYASTTETRAIQGWVALMVFLMKNFERLITDEAIAALIPWPAETYNTAGGRVANVTPQPGGGYRWGEERAQPDLQTSHWTLPDRDVLTPQTHSIDGIIVNPATYTIDHLKEEIRATGFLSAALCSWIDETRKRDGACTPFEGSLHELDIDSGSTSTTETPKAAAKKRHGRRYVTSEPMLAAA